MSANNWRTRKNGIHYRKKIGIASFLPPSETGGIPIKEQAKTSPTDFVKNQAKKFLDKVKPDVSQNEDESQKIIDEIKEKEETLEKVDEMIQNATMQKQMQTSDTNPQGVNLTDTPAPSDIEEQENKQVQNLQADEKLTELSGHIIEMYGENAKAAIEQLQSDQKEIDDTVEQLSQAADNNDSDKVKELEKKVKELQKKIEKDQKDAKQEVKNEQKQEKQLGKKVKESVKSLIDQPTQKLSSGTGIIAGRKQFSDEEKKSFQSEAFRESLLFYEGGAETLEEAKAQGLF